MVHKIIFVERVMFLYVNYFLLDPYSAEVSVLYLTSIPSNFPNIKSKNSYLIAM